jgi:hypothetical protein
MIVDLVTASRWIRKNNRVRSVFNLIVAELVLVAGLGHSRYTTGKRELFFDGYDSVPIW